MFWKCHERRTCNVMCSVVYTLHILYTVQSVKGGGGPWGPSFVHYNIINSERHKHIYWSLGESATITLTHSTGWRERVHSPPPSSLDYTFYARHVCDVWRRPQRRVQYLVFWCLLLWKAYKYKSCRHCLCMHKLPPSEIGKLLKCLLQIILSPFRT